MSVKPPPPTLLWREVPLFIMLLFMSTGMLIAHNWDAGAVVWLIPCAVAIPVAVLCLKLRYARYRLIATIVLSIVSGTTLYGSYELRIARKSMVSSRPGLAAMVTSSHVSSSGNLVAHLTPTGDERGAGILAIIMKPHPNIREGDTLMLHHAPSPIPNPRNSFEFDQAAYYRTLGIIHRTFLRDGDYSLHPAAGLTALQAGRVRRGILDKLETYISDSQARAVLYAMLFGDKTGVHAETRRIYSASGAMHILAISGLHIGIIASLLLLMTGNPSRTISRAGAILKGLAVLVVLWSYIWLVGLPPSACRAGGMFSLYIAGSVLRRRSHPLNILGATGIAAVVIDPIVITSVGFQFSYLALIGILTVGLPLYRMWQFRYRILQYAWGTIAISIGAQFLLIPMLVYYFNEISTMSALSSLLAIPAAYAIVVGGLVLTIVSYLAPQLAWAPGQALEFFIGHLTEILSQIGSHSWSTINRVFLSGPEAAILLVFMMLICARFATGNAVFIKVALIPALAFLIAHSVRYSVHTNKCSLTFYPSSVGPALELIHKGRSFQYGIDNLDKFTKDSAFRNRISNYARLISPHQKYPAGGLEADINIDFYQKRKGRLYYGPFKTNPIDLSGGSFQIQLK